MLALNKLIKCDGKKPEEINRAQFVKGTAANHGSLSVAHQPCSPLFYSKVPLPRHRGVEILCESDGTYFSFTFLYAVSTNLHHPVHGVFGSVLQRLHVVSGDQSQPSPPVTPVQTAGRCAGGGRCPSLCSVLKNIRKGVKCQAHFARKLSNLFGLLLNFNLKNGP